MPTLPPNLQTTHRYTRTTLLEPLIVYKTAVHFLSHSCIYGWDQPVPGIPFRRPSSPIGISVQQTRGAFYTPLRISYVFFALPEAISIMSAQEFRALDVIVFIDNRPIGSVRIFGRNPGSTLNNDNPITLPSTIPNANTPLDVGADSGIYIDPEHKYAIPYSFSHHYPQRRHLDQYHIRQHNHHPRQPGLALRVFTPTESDRECGFRYPRDQPTGYREATCHLRRRAVTSEKNDRIHLAASI